MLKQRFVTFLALLIVSASFAQVEYEKSPPDYIKTVIFRGSNSLQSELPLVELGDNLIEKLSKVGFVDVQKVQELSAALVIVSNNGLIKLLYCVFMARYRYCCNVGQSDCIGLS